MAITLDSTLEAAQENVSRKPIAKIISANAAEDIPFYGNRLGTASSAYTLRPHIVTLSDGRLAAFYLDDNVLKYIYTDTGKTQWTVSTSSFTMPTNHLAYGECLVELSNGNIGVLIRSFKSSTSEYKLLYATIEPDGTIITDATLIATYSSPVTIGEPHCILLANSTFLMVYAKYDGSTTYSIQKRTASSWGSFSSESAISLSGIDTSRPISNASLLQMSDDDIFLAFDLRDYATGENEIWNIYSSLSEDNGSTWSAPSARTNYSEYGSSALHPMMAQKTDGTVFLVYYDQTRVLKLDSDEFDHNTFYDSTNHGVLHIHYDAANNNLCVVWRYGILTDETRIAAVLVVDVDTWTVTKSYYGNSTPSLNNIFRDWDSEATGAGQYIFLRQDRCIAQIDTIGDTIRYYVIAIDESLGSYFSTTYGLQYNTDADLSYTLKPDIKNFDFDAVNNILWIIFYCGGSPYQGFWIGSLDITQSPDVYGYYDLNIIDSDRTYCVSSLDQTSFQYINELDYFLWTGGRDPYYGTSYTYLIDAETLSFVKSYNNNDNSEYPIHGLQHAWYIDGHIYGDFEYESDPPHTNRRGLCDINVSTDVITYHRPSYATVDQYWFRDAVYDEAHNSIILCSVAGGYYISIYDIASQYWTVFSQGNTPGLQPAGQGFWSLDYDPTTEMIYTGSNGSYSASSAGTLQAFNIGGALNQLSFNTYSGTWGTAANLAYYYNEREPACTIDEDDVLWVIWTRFSYSGDEYTLYYDRDEGEINVSNDLIKGSELSIAWELKTTITAAFTLARGHLYDPQNSLSLLSSALRKGRQISIYLGDEVNDVEYWQQQCLLFVNESKINYQKGTYPTITVACNDIREMYGQLEIVTTEFYNSQYPEGVIEDLLEDFGGLTSGDYNVPTFAARHTANQQYVDMALQEILDEIAAHWFYTPHVDFEGKYTFKRMQLDKAVDHAYSDLTKITEFTPDDSYSVYTNRITVKGETDDLTEVTYAEELVASVSGTIGWYEKKTTKKVWYSDDHTKVCSNPRLVKIQSIQLQGLLVDKLGSGGSESITKVEDTYCEITIDVPDLTAAIAADIAVIIVLAIEAEACYTCAWQPFYFAANICISSLIAMVCAMANYQYEIYANPKGTVQTTVQYTKNDTEFQQRIGGIIVPTTIDDSLCNTVDQCQRVAEGEMELVQAQRNRVSFKKVADLRDEITDKISVLHPYSGETIELVITKLTRTYQKGVGMFDKPEGWRTA